LFFVDLNTCSEVVVNFLETPFPTAADTIDGVQFMRYSSQN